MRRVKSDRVAPTIRLNKFLAESGVASRRAADELIAHGHVTIDGRRAKPGDRVDPGSSDVRVDGKRVATPTAAHITIALNKPKGVITTMRDERGRPCVGDLLKLELRSSTTSGRSSTTTRDSKRRLFPIGRLDAETTGVLLCTSDGELARRLAHPSFEVPRRYHVTVNAVPGDDAVQKLGAQHVKRRADGGAQFEVTLMRGQNREIRRACAQAGLRVTQLERIAYGPILLRGLAPGERRTLTAAETRALHQSVKEGPS